MDVLPQIGGQVAALRNRAGKTEIEIRQIVAGRVGGDGATGGLPELGAGRFAVLSAVGIGAVQRVDVEHLGSDREKLVAGLHRMPPTNHRIIELRIQGSRILELRIGGLPAERRVAEAGDDLRGEPAGQARRLAQDAVLSRDVRPAQIRRRLPAEHVSESEARLEQRRRSHRPGVARGGLLLNRVDKAVAVAAGRSRIGRPEESDVLALAEAQERGHAARDLIVQFGVVLVAVVA